MAHILIVDDRPMNREFLVTLLGYYGHTLAEAGDGVEALARVSERKPDLVITDLLMPNMDGEEFARRLRADPATQGVPVIIYTATYRMREARIIANRVGVRKVLPKPSDPEVIVAAIAAELGAPAPAPAHMAAAPALAPARETTVLAKGVVKELDSVANLNLTLATLLENAVEVAKQQAKSLLSVRAVEDALQNVQSLSLRLTGLVELGLDLSRARDPRDLIELFCRALQDILSAHYAGVVVVAGEGEPPRSFAARGLNDATHARVAAEIGACAAAARVIGPGGAGRPVISVKAEDVTGLPASHPPVKNFLACALAAHDKTIGWLYVADRLSQQAFSTEDERIAMALGAQFAIAWDSLGLYTELGHVVAQRTRQLEATNRELEAFSHSVSHDLRAPLRAIGGYAEILRRDHAARLEPDAWNLIDRIDNNVKRMAMLIDDLLEFARLGRKALSPQQLNLAHLVNECLNDLAQEREGRDVKISIGEIPPCRGDVILLKQVILNLLGNALKYTRKRDGARIEIAAAARGGEYVFQIRDNGAGFDMRYAGKLFEVFQRLHGQNEFEGSGVGLAIVKRAIEKHGGRVWAEAEPDQGATFYFSLPASGARAAGA